MAKRTTKKDLRHAIFKFKNAIREELVNNYAKYGENPPNPELWKNIHNIWSQMNEYCKSI